MNEADYTRYQSYRPCSKKKALTYSFSVIDTLRLADGTLFSMPITLDVSSADIQRLSIIPGARIALRDPRDDEALAIITVDDVYSYDLVKETIQVFGADDPAHPSVAYLRNRVKPFYVGGNVQAIQAPSHFDYVALRCKWCQSPSYMFR